jgi:hypothetical protein
MALKTFNIDEKTYKQYSEHCKKQGISMSKQIENFIKSEIENLKSNSSNKNSNHSNSKVEHQQAAHETSPANSHENHEHTFAKYC